MYLHCLLAELTRHSHVVTGYLDGISEAHGVVWRHAINEVVANAELPNHSLQPHLIGA